MTTLFLVAIIAAAIAVAVAAGRVEASVARLRADVMQSPPVPRGSVARHRQPPALVAAFAARAGVDDGAVGVAVLRQLGELRMGPNKPWRPMPALQLIALDHCGFVWDARTRFGPLTTLRVIDAFTRGGGLLVARALGFVPVATLTGPAADASELMRYLAELPWAPDAIVRNESLVFRQLDETRVATSARVGDTVVTVTHRFDTDGDIVEMTAESRGSTERGVVVPRPWIGRFRDYRRLGSRRIPTRAEVGYVYDDGYAAYWRGKIADYALR